MQSLVFSRLSGSPVPVVQSRTLLLLTANPGQQVEPGLPQANQGVVLELTESDTTTVEAMA